MLRTANEVIDALGGTSAVCRLTKRKSPQVVSYWRAANRIPAYAYLTITRELAKIGCRVSPDLFGIVDSPA